MRISDWSSDVCSSDLDNRKGKRTDRAETEQAGDDVVTEGTWHQKSPSWGAWGDGKSARRSAAQSRPASARKACANADGSRPPHSSGSSVEIGRPPCRGRRGQDGWHAGESGTMKK